MGRWTYEYGRGLEMGYVIRKDLVAQDLAIPDARNSGYYTDDIVRTLTFVAWVNDSTYEHD